MERSFIKKAGTIAVVAGAALGAAPAVYAAKKYR